jgi:hypothetical protein
VEAGQQRRQLNPFVEKLDFTKVSTEAAARRLFICVALFILSQTLVTQGAIHVPGVFRRYPKVSRKGKRCLIGWMEWEG